MSDDFGNTINTAIWSEIAQPDNPFVADKCYCHGYDVFDDVLGNAGFIEYLYLLFMGERPNPNQVAALNLLAIALANPGPRDPSVHGAMAAYVSGTPAANALMAALAIGAGSHQGAREVMLAMTRCDACGTDLPAWQQALQNPVTASRLGIWPENNNPAGFDPYGSLIAAPALRTLEKLLPLLDNSLLSWLAQQRLQLEALAGRPFTLLGIAAAAFSSLGFKPAQGEMLTLLLRLPGAAVHALEQKERGFRQFPFFSIDLEHDPKSSPIPEAT